MEDDTVSALRRAKTDVDSAMIRLVGHDEDPKLTAGEREGLRRIMVKLGDVEKSIVKLLDSGQR